MDDYNNNNNTDNEYEEVCAICKRPESQVGKLIRMEGNICVCPNCIQKTIDYMKSNGSMQIFSVPKPGSGMPDLSDLSGITGNSNGENGNNNSGGSNGNGGNNGGNDIGELMNFVFGDLMGVPQRQKLKKKRINQKKSRMISRQSLTLRT